jgi:hypothetical protein
MLNSGLGRDSKLITEELCDLEGSLGSAWSRKGPRVGSNFDAGVVGSGKPNKREAQRTNSRQKPSPFCPSSG